MTILKAILFFIFVHQSAFAINQCEVNFIKYINGDMPADITKNPTVNMWDDRFQADALIEHLSKLSVEKQQTYIIQLSKLVHKNSSFNRNISQLVTYLHQEKVLPFKFVKRHFLDKDFEHTVFYYSQNRREVVSQINNDPIKYEFAKEFADSQNLPKHYRREYLNALMESNRTLEEIEIMIKHGMRFEANAKHLDQFMRYMEFLDNARPHKVPSGLKNIQKIYDFNYKHGVVPYNPLRGIHNQFLDQVSRIKKFQLRRAKEIEKGFKLQMKTDTITEIDEAVKRELQGAIVDQREKLRFAKKIEDATLPRSLKRRAMVQAKHEANIFRRLMNGCNSGSSQRIAGVKKKFSRFKFALTLASTPTFYIMNNKDKMDTDPYFWEKLGHEMVLGLVFTYVGNKIITNTGKGFWSKYFNTYMKFGVLSYAEAYSYEELFGKKSAIRHFQKLYKDNVPESEMEVEFKKLMASPDFDKQVQDLVKYLDKMGEKNNTKNFFDKYLNLSASSSIDDEFRITQEDLKSEEAREFMMELLAERIYLQNMGDWAFFQTGRKDTDRFAFYRTTSILSDMKGLLINLAIFEIMCREPFGKIGSWGAIFALIVADKYLTGDMTSQYRREMINQ